MLKREELLKTAKPILFNTEMVRAILDGRKTVTRRVVKNGNRTPTVVGRDKFYTYVDVLNGKTFNGAGFYRDSDIFQIDGVNHTDAEYFKTHYVQGDILYVRETWSEVEITEAYAPPCYTGNFVYYKADNDGIESCGAFRGWKPSIHMPKSAARIFLKVTDVRCERLQDITEEQATAEGAKARGNGNCSGTSARIAFAEIWDKTVTEKQYEWSSSPWVWVYEFEVLQVD